MLALQQVRLHLENKSLTHYTISNSIFIIKIIKAFSAIHNSSKIRSTIYLLDYCSQLFAFKNPKIPNSICGNFKKYLISCKCSWEYADVNFYHIYENANLIISGKRSFAIFDNISHMTDFEIQDSLKNSLETINVLVSLTAIFRDYNARLYLLSNIYSYLNRLFLLPEKNLLRGHKFIHIAFFKMNQFYIDIRKKKTLNYKLRKLIIHEMETFAKNYKGFVS